MREDDSRIAHRAQILYVMETCESKKARERTERLELLESIRILLQTGEIQLGEPAQESICQVERLRRNEEQQAARLKGYYNLLYED